MGENVIKVLEVLVSDNEKNKSYKTLWDEENTLYRAYKLSGKHYSLYKSRDNIRSGNCDRVDIIRFIALASGPNDALLMWKLAMDNLGYGEIQSLVFGRLSKMSQRCRQTNKVVMFEVSLLIDRVTDEVDHLCIKGLAKLCKSIGYSLTRGQYEAIRDFNGRRTIYNMNNVELLLLLGEHDKALTSMMVADHVGMKDDKNTLSIWWYMARMEVGISHLWLSALARDIEYLGTVTDHVVVTEAVTECLGRVKGVTIPLANALRSYFDNKPISVYSRDRDKMITEMSKVAGCGFLMDWLGTQFNDMEQPTRTAYLAGLSEMTNRAIGRNQDVIKKITDEVNYLTQQLYDK